MILSLSSLNSPTSFKLIGLALCASFLLHSINSSLSTQIEQPLKYRMICAGADFINYFGSVLEYFNAGHRLNLTRFAYHWTVGAFNIRDPAHSIQIIDEEIEHLSIRIFRPQNQTKTLVPTLIFYHGGGYFIGSADILEPVTYLLAKQTNFQVIYIEFRLIPEYKYPAALTDSMLATKYLIKNNLNYKIDLDNVILMGDSAGGNLAAVISQKLISQKILNPKLQVLVYPILQFFDFTLPSYRQYMSERILGNIDHENFKNFLHYFTAIKVDDTVFHNGHTSGLHKESILSEYVNVNYLPSKYRNHKLGSPVWLNDTTGKYSKLADIVLHQDVSPLLVDDDYLLANTPRHTYLVTAELDILRDDGFIYAARLKKVGRHVHHKHYENIFHGVLNLVHGPLEFRAARDLLQDITNVIKQIVLNH